MLFANPLLLMGTALVALPIVLHLIMRRQPRHLEFPAVRFVQKRHKTNQRRLRLRHLLLLLLRTAAIVLLALALARPSVKLSRISQEAPVAAALVFDTAPRMEYRQDNRTRLDVARDIGARLMAQLPRESQIAVLDTRLGPAVFQADRGSALQRIRQLETVGNSQPLTRVIDEGLQLIGQSELPAKEIYIFTDLTRGAWPAGSATRLQDRLNEVPGAGIYVIDVGVEKPSDFALGELHLSAQVLSDRSTLQIDTDLSALGIGGQRTVELYLLDRQGDRTPQKRDATAYTLVAGGSQHVEFRLGGLGLGTHQGCVRIMGQDGLAADDTRYFTVEVQRAWRVLMAAPKPTGDYVQFFPQALAPDVFRKQGQAPFDCDVMSLEQLAQLTPQALQAYAAVCLLDPKPLEPAVWRKLTNYASEGHGVAVFLGRNAQPTESFNDPAAQELLPAKLVRQARRPDGSLYLAPRDYQHPVLAEFRDRAGSVPWNLSPVYRYWEVDHQAAGTNVIVPFNDDRPALLERPVGKGRALVMTTPVSDRPSSDPWNLLPAGDIWPFVILANQIASYLVGSADQQFNYFAGQTAVLQLDRQSPSHTYVMTTPNDLKFNLSSDAQHNALTITATDRPGYYRIQAGGERGIDRGLTVNLAPDQTRLDRLPPEKLDEMFGPFEHRVVRGKEQLDRAVSTGRIGQELFPLLILVLAAVLGLEHLVANRFYKEGGRGKGEGGMEKATA